MRIRSLILTPVAVLSMLIGVLALAGTPAQAATVRSKIGSFGSEGPGSSGFTDPESIAVEQSTGDVYVWARTKGQTGKNSVYKFNAIGEPVDFSSTATNMIGSFSVQGFEGEIAVDNSTGPDKGDIYITNYDSEEVNIFNSNGEELPALSANEFVCGVAVDASGALYASIPSDAIEKYVPVTNPVEHKNLTNILEGVTNNCNIAADAAGDIYAVAEGETVKGEGGVVTKYEASQIETEEGSGTVIDAGDKAATLAVDPASGKVYVDEQSDIAVYSPGGTTREEEFGSGLLNGSFGVAVSDASEHVGDVYASVCHGECEVVIFGLPSAATEFPLKVEKEGTGGTEGKVTSSPPGITCGAGAGCEAEFEEGETVTLTATEEGATFTKWTGCKAEPTPTTCEVEMTAAKTVKAEFTAAVLAEFPVNVTVTGKGAVSGATIAGCTETGGVCTEKQKETKTVKLTETPEPGSKFEGWSGVTCTGGPMASTCEFTMPGAEAKPLAKYGVLTTSPLNVYITGNGEVKGTTIACTQLGGACEEQAKGPTTLTATPAPGTGYVLAGWIGCKKTGADTCEVDVTTPSEVTAVFLLEGKEGSKGTTGPTGPPGLSGDQGEKGVAGTTGTNGQNGIPGPAALPGPIGPTGAQGPAGGQGPAGPAGQVEIVTCKKVGKHQKCTTKPVSGTVKFTANTASAHATLSRHGAVFAAGTAQVAHGRLSLRLTPLRKLRSGHYTLTLVSGAGKHETIRSEAFTLG